MPVFLQGDRVTANGQPGTVRYVRMAPPTFRNPEAYSVALDSQTHRSSYVGSIFPAEEVLFLGSEKSSTPE